jgi:hypothetical protein
MRRRNAIKSIVKAIAGGERRKTHTLKKLIAKGEKEEDLRDCEQLK